MHLSDYPEPEAPPFLPQPPDTGALPLPTTPGFQLAPSDRKWSNWKRFGLGMAIVLVLLTGAGFAIFFASRGPIDAANNYLAAVVAEDFVTSHAMQSMSPDCFGGLASGEVEEFYTTARISDYNLRTSYVQVVNGDTTGTTSGAVSSSYGYEILISLVKESDVWKICSLRIN